MLVTYYVSLHIHFIYFQASRIMRKMSQRHADKNILNDAKNSNIF